MIATLYFDGSFRNKKLYGGWVALVFTEPILVGAGCSVANPPKGSSNESEWLAMFAGLQWITQIRGLERVNIRGDADSIIEGLKGTVKSRGTGASYKDQCITLLADKHIRWSASRIDRKQNVFAHRLSRGSSSGVALGDTEGYVNHAQVKLLHVLAEALWTQAGKPHGRDIEFWTEAENLFFDSVTPAKPERTTIKMEE